MARVVSNSIIDCRLSGTIGDKVFYVIRGKQYMKAKMPKVSRPKSAAQLDQGSRFKLVSQFLKPLSAFLRESFKIKTDKMSAYNAAFSHCVRHSIAGTYPDYRIDYPRVLVSKGPAPMAAFPKVNAMADAGLEFTWQGDPRQYEGRNDRVMLVVYNPSKQQAVTVMGGNNRMSESQVMSLPADFAGDEVHCWIAFQQSSPPRVSDSVYVGKVTVN